ncbi:MAG: hypothetical protein Q9200_002303 [Gallowayella weberi]
MKSFIVSAVVGATIIGLSGVTTILGVEAAAIPTEDVKRSDAGSLATFTKRQDIIVTTPCWETEDGQVRCAPKMEKRQSCWETEDGQVRCPPKMEKRQSCWETEDGQVRCPPKMVKRQDCVVTTPCWETEDGQVRCAPKEKRDELGASTASSSNNSADQPLPSAPLFPVVRATEAKTSTAPSSYAAPTLPTGGLLTSLGTVTTSNRNSVAAVATAQSASASVAAITSPPSSECRSVTFKDWGTVGSSSGYYDIDSAGHTCATHQIPPAYGPNPPPTTEADTDAPQTSSLAVTSGYAFGAPAQTTASLTAATSLATGNVTAAGTALRDDGRCGLVEFNRATCDPNGEFGGCCSSHGYCGKTNDHCGAGCLSGCNNGTISITGARPTTKALESGVVVGPAGPQVSD